MPRSPFLNNEPLIETQGFMENPQTYPETHGHAGIDLRAPTGRQLTSCVEDAVAHFVDYKNWLGRWNAYGASINLDWGQADGTFIRFLYGHCQNRKKQLEGQHVQPGTLLGESDNTGFSTAPHLHFEMRHYTFVGNFYDRRLNARYFLLNPLTEFFQKNHIPVVTG